MYAIVIVRPSGDKRLFGRVRRSQRGDVYVIWAEDASPRNPVKGGNPHASYHAKGRLHSKIYNLVAAIKRLQVPTNEFRGNQPIEVTNAERALSPTLPAINGQFDNVFEIPLELVSGNRNQSIGVHLVEPGVAPIEVTGKDNVLAEKVFKDDVPWIVVRLVEPAVIPYVYAKVGREAVRMENADQPKEPGLRTAFNIFAAVAGVFGLGLELEGSHPYIGILLMVAALAYGGWELFTSPTAIQKFPRSARLGFLAILSGCLLLVSWPHLKEIATHKHPPAPVPRFPSLVEQRPNSETQGAEDEAGAKPQHPSIEPVPKKRQKEAKNRQAELPKNTFLGIHKPTETVVIPPNSSAIISPGPVSPTDMAGLDRMKKEETQAEEHLKRDPDKLVLHDLFWTDFSSGDTSSTNYSGFTLRNDKTGSLTHIEYAVVRQLETGTKFLMFYVLYNNETQQICESLADKYKVALEDFMEGRIDTQKTPGDSEQTSSKDLVFSNRIFIYHETYLSPEEIIAVRDAYRRQGITVVLRSTDYLANKKLEAKLKQLEQRH